MLLDCLHSIGQYIIGYEEFDESACDSSRSTFTIAALSALTAIVAVNILKNCYQPASSTSNNQLTHPPDVRHNSQLTSLRFDKTQLTDPPDLSHYPQLTYLKLFGNQLTHPPNVSNNPQLTHLYVSKSQLTESPDVSNNPQLTLLYLDNNQLTESPDVSHNSQLTQLNLSRNQLTESPDVSHNPQLTSLYLSYNQLTDPPDVSHNSQLTQLNLSRNQLTHPPDVSNNPQLTSLYLEHSQLTDPPDVSHNSQLTHLYISFNRLTELHDSILALPCGCNVYAENNRFSAAYVQDFLQRLEQHRLDHPGQGPTVHLSIHDDRLIDADVLLLENQLQFWTREFAKAFPKQEDQQDVSSLLHSLRDTEKETLAKYLSRLREVEDYTNGGEARKNVILQVNRLLQLACKNEEFKNDMIALITEGLGTCVDRVLIVFNDLEILWRFAHQELSPEAFKSLAGREGRYELLKKHATEECERLRLGDEIETTLYFQLKLKTPLDLPITTESMSYAGAAGVTADMLITAETKMRSFSEEELLTNSPHWEKHLRKQHPEKFEAVNENYTDLLLEAGEFFDATDQENEELDAFFRANPSSKQMNYPDLAKFIEKKQCEAIRELIQELTRRTLEIEGCPGPSRS